MRCVINCLSKIYLSNVDRAFLIIIKSNMPENIKPTNANSSFFDGYYKDIWRQFFPEKTTKAEVDFIISDAKLVPGNSVIDIMCGYERHSLEMGRRRIEVTAVDNLCDYINEIKVKVEAEKLPIETLCEDVLEMQINKQFDAAI